MKIQVVSDIHLEFFNNITKVDSFINKLITDADVLILAGDICTLDKEIYIHNSPVNCLKYFIEKVSNKYKYVIYVLGNHEYYCNDFKTTLKHIKLITSEINNVYVLENNSVVINDVIFHGTTLWFKESPQAILNTSYLNDFKCITNFNPYTANSKAVKYIESIENLNQVLITHHLPSYKSVADYYLREITNCYYVCDIEQHLNKFALVVHGHTHNSCDYLLNNTKIVCNPYGYLAQNKEFNFSKVIEIC